MIGATIGILIGFFIGSFLFYWLKYKLSTTNTQDVKASVRHIAKKPKYRDEIYRDHWREFK